MVMVAVWLLLWLQHVVAMLQEPVVTVSDDYVEMEMDCVNQHECMASLTALLKHMKRNNIIPDLKQVRSHRPRTPNVFTYTYWI